MPPSGHQPSPQYELPGQRLEACFDYQNIRIHTGKGIEKRMIQQRMITPAVVRKIINVALSRGWQPSEKGLKALRLQDEDAIAPVEDEIANNSLESDA